MKPPALLRFEPGEHRMLFIPRHQVLALQFLPKNPEQVIEFWISLGVIRLRGTRLEGLWCRVVSGATTLRIGVGESGEEVAAIDTRLLADPTR